MSYLPAPGAYLYIDKASPKREARILRSLFNGTFAMSVEEMKSDMRNNKVDLDNLAIEDLGIYANPEAALKLATLHHAKGGNIRP
jgi:DNA helicase-2/ATP-dependent DNA helicase PcrA